MLGEDFVARLEPGLLLLSSLLVLVWLCDLWCRLESREDDVRAVVEERLSSFCMISAYPESDLIIGFNVVVSAGRMSELLTIMYVLCLKSSITPNSVCAE